MGLSPTQGSLFFLGKCDCLGCTVLLCLVVCMTLVASFFHLSLKHTHTCSQWSTGEGIPSSTQWVKLQQWSGMAGLGWWNMGVASSPPPWGLLSLTLSTARRICTFSTELSVCTFMHWHKKCGTEISNNY